MCGLSRQLGCVGCWAKSQENIKYDYHRLRSDCTNKWFSMFGLLLGNMTLINALYMHSSCSGVGVRRGTHWILPDTLVKWSKKTGYTNRAIPYSPFSSASLSNLLPAFFKQSINADNKWTYKQQN